MQTAVEEGMARVAAIAERVGVAELAREAGMAQSTVRSFRDRGWTAESLLHCERLIAAAERLERSNAPPSRRHRARA